MKKLSSEREPNHGSKAGVWLCLWSSHCSNCGHHSKSEVPMYVHDSSWPDFIDLALEGRFISTTCPKCHLPIKNDAPFIFDSSRYGLLVFVVHDGDNTDIDINFHTHLEAAGRHLSNDIIQDAKKRPYTFVDTWRGFSALLEYFKDIRTKHEEYIDQAELIADGYIYGKLFFYYPNESPIENFVKGFLSIAEHHRLKNRHDLAYRVLLDATNFIGISSQWLTQDLGATALHLGKIEEAKHWLKLAVGLQHQWLACTASFFDPTALVKRADGVTQDQALPHTSHASSRGKVTDVKHVLSRLLPPRSDFGLWYFPKMERFIFLRAQLSIESLLRAYGVVLGELHYCKELYGGLTMHTGAASFFLCDGFFAFMRTMKDRHIDIDESAFWSEYSIRRWSIPRNWREIAFSKDIHSIREIAKKFGEVNGKAQQQLGETMDPSEKIFLKNSGIYASRTSDVFIDLCPIDQQEGLLKIMFQAGFDALNGPGAGEVISVSRSRGNIIPRKRVRWSPHPHPNANPELAAKLNLKYQEEVARWKKLSWWKRIRTKPPTPPEAN